MISPDSISYLDEANVAAGLPYPKLIAELKNAFSSGGAQPARLHYQMNDIDCGAEMLVMPSWSRKAIAVKIVTLFCSNSELNLPVIQGVVVAFDSQTGRPLAVIDAGELTARRTAAASALASSFLSNENAEHLLLVGTGRLVPYLAEAHSVVRRLKRISIFGRDEEKASLIAAKVARIVDQDIDVGAVANLQKTVSNAHIIATATRSVEPLIQYRWLRPGVHLDLVGGYRPDMREVDNETIVNAKLFADTKCGVLAEAGDIIQPMKKGLITKEDIAADLSCLSAGLHRGRSKSEHVTLFKSVGAAIEDLAATTLLLQQLYEHSQ